MQIKALQRCDHFNMKHKFLILHITVIHGSSIIHFQFLMFWNKGEHKKYGFISISCLFLDAISFELERSVKFFKKNIKQKATNNHI